MGQREIAWHRGTGLCNTLEVLEGDLASLIIIKEPESLQNLIFRVAILWVIIFRNLADQDAYVD